MNTHPTGEKKLTCSECEQHQEILQGSIHQADAPNCLVRTYEFSTGESWEERAREEFIEYQIRTFLTPTTSDQTSEV